MSNTNNAAIVEWFDDINPDSYVLCTDHYGIKIIHTNVIDDYTTEVVVYGPVENVKNFMADFNDDSIEPLEHMQAGDYDDEDYEAYLNNEVNHWFDVYDYAVQNTADYEPEQPETNHYDVEC